MILLIGREWGGVGAEGRKGKAISKGKKKTDVAIRLSSFGFNGMFQSPNISHYPTIFSLSHYRSLFLGPQHQWLSFRWG